MTSPDPAIFINEAQVADDIAAAVAAEATEREAADAALQDAIDAGGSGVAIDDTTPSTGTVFSSTKVNAIVAAAIAGPDDVLSFANLAAFPATGALDTLYVALDTNFLYRWSGSAYVQVGGGGSTVSALTDVAATATVDGPLVVSQHNPVDSSTGNRAMTLANATAGGKLVSFEKTTSDTNTVTVTLNLRGTTSTLVARSLSRALLLLSKADGSWWPIGDHMTETAINALIAAGSGSSVNPNDVGYDIVVLAGQSNMAGKGTAYDLTHYDPIDPRVDIFAATGATFPGVISKAVEPTSAFMPEKPVATQVGMGPGIVFGRYYASTLPSNRRVLLVAAAFGGTPLSQGNDAFGAQRRWKVGDTTASTQLFASMITQTNAAYAAAELVFPGKNRIVGMLWHQGEQDVTNGTSQATYQTDMDALIDEFRTQLSVPTAWVILGQMKPTPRGGTGSAGIAANGINKAHIDTPKRKTLTGFAYAPDNAADPTNGALHFSASDQRILGANYFQQLPVARANVLSVAPLPPTAVTLATTSTTTITAFLIRSATRATNFVWQRSTDGGTTWTTLADPASISAYYYLTGLTPGSTVYVRAATVNEQGTSAFCAPASIVVSAPVDTTPPVISSFTATPVNSQNNLAWAGTDNVAITRWTVVRDGATTVYDGTATSVNDGGLTNGTSYAYVLTAYDAAGNTVTASTSATPAVGASFVNDTMTDTAGVLITAHTGETGAVWVKTGTPGVSNAAITAGGRLRNNQAATSQFYASGVPSSANYTVEADFYFASLITGTSSGIWGRAMTNDGTSFGYVVRYVVTAGNWQLVKVVGGTSTTIGSFTAAPAVGSTVHAKLVMVGSTISMVVAGVTQASVTDTDLTAAGAVNAQFTGSTTHTDSTGIHIDNVTAT